MDKKLTMLMILDGFGMNEKEEGNAVKMASIPNLNRILTENPNTVIHTSGTDVGLPEGQMGNSEVGHTNIGAGRIIYQDLAKITKSIEDGDFFSKPEFLAAIVKNIILNYILWDYYQMVVYTVIIVIYMVCLKWQKEKTLKMFLYIAF